MSTCLHPNIEVSPPCCTTPEPDTGYIACACNGETQVYCPDCDNLDLTDEQLEDILFNQIYEPLNRSTPHVRL